MRRQTSPQPGAQLDLFHPFPKMPQWTHLPQEAQQETVRLLEQPSVCINLFCRPRDVWARFKCPMPAAITSVITADPLRIPAVLESIGHLNRFVRSSAGRSGCSGSPAYPEKMMCVGSGHRDRKHRLLPWASKL